MCHYLLVSSNDLFVNLVRRQPLSFFYFAYGLLSFFLRSTLLAATAHGRSKTVTAKSKQRVTEMFVESDKKIRSCLM
jgi:hypothetical protein